MAQFIAKWDAGYGTNIEVVEANDQNDAETQAYDRWNDEVHSNGFYTAKSATAVELLEMGEDPLGYGIYPTLAECEQYGLDPEDFGYEIDEDAI